MAAQCSQRELCLADIDEKLSKYDLAPEACERIKAKLVTERYIDEARYASYFARDKARFNGWGPQKIVFMLRQKRIDKDVIAEAIESIGNEVFAEQLMHALEAKYRSAKQSDPQKKWASLVRLGVSRGFDYEAVKKAVELIIDA